MPAKKSTYKIERTTALCYVRKSWTRDEKDEVSPIRQRDHIQAVCDAHRWNPEWYEDVDGHRSGMYEKNRPGWLSLKARLGDADVVALVANGLSPHNTYLEVGGLTDAKHLIFFVNYYERDFIPQLTTQQRDQQIRERSK